MSNEDKPEKADKYFWRLVGCQACHDRGSKISCALTLEWHSKAVICSPDHWLEDDSCGFDTDGKPRPHILLLLNALLAADALDWSELSRETCSALRGLGVEIPEQKRCG